MSFTSIIVAADMAEATGIQRLLAEAGIATSLELVESLAIGSLGAGPCRVLVDVSDRDEAIAVLQGELDEDDDEDT